MSLLATSREALEVPGERVMRVRSLDAPEPSATGDDLLGTSAVRLFRDRATDAGATTTWNGAQWSAVGEICRRVDGIPLAIELAAARVTSMSPTDIAARLDERFRLLTGKRRGRVERHQTLRATVEWSYQLLEDDERTVFDRLGVFSGTFDAAGAADIAGDDDLDGWRIMDSISSLVAKSMLVAEDGPDGTSRYTMYETLRQFARERLEETGDADRWRRRHAEHYVKFAERVGLGVQGADQYLWSSRLDCELDNVRVAIGWALDRDEPEDRDLAVEILAALADMAQQHVTVGFDALAAQAAPVAEHCRPEIRAPALSTASYYEANQGRPERARELAQAAMRGGIVTTSSHPFHPQLTLAFIEITSGHYRRALEILDNARAAVGTVDNPYAEARLHSTMAMFEAMAGQVDQARSDAERAMELARRLENPTALANAFHATAWALQRDDPAGALAAAEQYFDIYRVGHGGAGAVGALALGGGLRARLGDPVGALELLHEAVVASRDQGTRPQLASAFDWSLAPLVKLGRPEAAATLVAALTRGALVEVSQFPGVDEPRARILDRVRATLTAEATEALVAAGAAMSYDEIVEYAINHLGPD